MTSPMTVLSAKCVPGGNHALSAGSWRGSSASSLAQRGA